MQVAGGTAVHMAVGGGNLKIIKCLIEIFPDARDVKDKVNSNSPLFVRHVHFLWQLQSDKSPSQLAEDMGNQEIAALLGLDDDDDDDFTEEQQSLEGSSHAKVHAQRQLLYFKITAWNAIMSNTGENLKVPKSCVFYERCCQTASTKRHKTCESASKSMCMA